VPQFEVLEQFIAEEAALRGGIPLTRLRIHDILIWTFVVKEQWMDARASGAVLGF
jgi:hypothetical protein